MYTYVHKSHWPFLMYTRVLYLIGCIPRAVCCMLSIFTCRFVILGDYISLSRFTDVLSQVLFGVGSLVYLFRLPHQPGASIFQSDELTLFYAMKEKKLKKLVVIDLVQRFSPQHVHTSSRYNILKQSQRLPYPHMRHTQGITHDQEDAGLAIYPFYRRESTNRIALLR